MYQMQNVLLVVQYSSASRTNERKGAATSKETHVCIIFPTRNKSKASSSLKVKGPGGVDHTLATDKLGLGPADGDLAGGIEDGTGHAGLVALGADGTLHLPEVSIAGEQAEDAVVAHLEEGGFAARDGFGQDGQDAALGPEEAGSQDVTGGEGGGDEGVELVQEDGDEDGDEKAKDGRTAGSTGLLVDAGAALGRSWGGSGGVELRCEIWSGCF